MTRDEKIEKIAESMFQRTVLPQKIGRWAETAWEVRAQYRHIAEIALDTIETFNPTDPPSTLSTNG